MFFVCKAVERIRLILNVYLWIKPTGRLKNSTHLNSIKEVKQKLVQQLQRYFYKRQM